MIRYLFLSAMVLLQLGFGGTFSGGAEDVRYEQICEQPQDITIAVTTVEMSNKTAKLVFKESGVQDQIAVALKQSNCYRVVDWKHLRDVISRHQLQWSDILSDGKSREKLQQLLAVDYFLMANIHSYSSDVEYSNSTFSKEKQQNVALEIDFIVKNALTNEYVQTVSTKGFASQTISHSLGFGTSANTSQKVSNLALHHAIEDGMKQLMKLSLKQVSTHKQASSKQNELLSMIDVDDISASMQKLVAKSNAQECPGKWVQTKGFSTLDKGRYQAKKRALMDAYRSAVSKGSGVKIRSFSQLDISDSMSHAYSIIKKRSDGFISYYEIISEGRDGDMYSVDMKACVVSGDVDAGDEKQGLEQFIAMIGEPKILIVLGQKNDTKQQLDSLELRTAETVMAEFFKKLGYEVVTSDDLVGRGFAQEDEIKKARNGIGGEAIKLARVVSADVLVSGALTFGIEKTDMADTKASLVSASFNAKLMAPGSGKTLSIYNKQNKFVNLTDNALSNKDKVIKQTAVEMAYTLAWDIPKYLLEEEREIEIVLKDVSYRTMKKIMRVLQNEEGVLDIHSKGRWKKTGKKLGRTWLVVTTSFFGVTADAIIEALESKGYDIDLNVVSDYYLDISVGK